MAETKKPEKKKPATKKKRAEARPKTSLVSYSIKMVIPTGEYANIQPEIIVKGSSVEEAHDFIAPHMNRLWKEYYLINQRRPQVAPTPPAPAPVVKLVEPVKTVEAPKVETGVKLEPAKKEKSTPVNTDEPPFKGDELAKKPEPVEETPPPSSVAYVKATQAIESCLSIDAFNLIVEQVEKSVKLTEEDKKNLQPLLAQRFEKLVKE